MMIAAVAADAKTIRFGALALSGTHTNAKSVPPNAVPNARSHDHAAPYRPCTMCDVEQTHAEQRTDSPREVRCIASSEPGKEQEGDSQRCEPATHFQKRMERLALIWQRRELTRHQSQHGWRNCRDQY